MEDNQINKELENVFKHYLSKGIDHMIPKEEWRDKSKQIKNCIISSLDQYTDVEDLYINVNDCDIEFESYGTKFLSLKWAEGIAYWYAPMKKEFPLHLFAKEVRACFWPTLNFIIEDRNQRHTEASWQLGGTE